MNVRSYHHGDLRAALIEAGLGLLAEREGLDLSLREVARSVGVSPTAVYRHFADKDALRVALAQEGFDRLAAVQHQAAEAEGGGSAGFAATGRAYVRFALANPALFRLMFVSQAPLDVMGRSGKTVPEAAAFLRANAAAEAPPGADAALVEALALRAWAIAHGLAMLMLDGQVAPSEALISAVVDVRPIGLG